MLRIPMTAENTAMFAKELVDECGATVEERQNIYEKATQFYYTGSQDVRAAIHNKIKTFIDRLSGFLYQPSTVRFNLTFESHEPLTMLERGRVFSELLSNDFKATDADLRFSDAVTFALINGCYFLKHIWLPGDTHFRVVPVHPVNMGVLTESTNGLDEQECFVHFSYPTVTKLRSDLLRTARTEEQVRRVNAIIAKIDEARTTKDETEPTYFHSMVIGGLNPVGEPNMRPEAAGVVQVFPVPTPWRPQKRVARTVKLCELWIKDERKGGDYTTLQLIYPDILITGDLNHINLSGIPGHHCFTKVEATQTPGYFWGRSSIADVQMVQEVINKRLRDLKIMWDRNAAAPYTFSGFNNITEEVYFKLISEGGYISDPNPQAKAQKLIEPPSPGYLEELEFLWQMFDESGGFSKVMTGQGESGVRSGAHADTLVRQSSPGLIDPATRVERCLADSGYLCARLMQNNDALIYKTESGTEFILEQIAERFQVEVDSHSASPAFAEDSRQIAVALAKAQAIDAEELIVMLHPPNADLLIARLKQRQQQQAKLQQEMAARGQAPQQQPQKHR